MFIEIEDYNGNTIQSIEIKGADHDINNGAVIIRQEEKGKPIEIFMQYLWDLYKKGE